ncbi:hypothetical protein [Candidatus Protochlamydia amoebophila]|uniref:Uncharacterized protein n=1 Tax=Protochlamydia amoebophila (strain UWE25) TaxID=264201 RepID=Q6MCX1_PARUW|nr:hypothetical protein [Candidatus Protochlamydia amoebophila]CAF23578.1 unnamed protein product [Candidatus Protochlamydia amoebophila UWE25]
MASKLEEAQSILNNILSEWDHFSTPLQNIKEEELEKDLFFQIDFLSQLDKVKARISFQMQQLEKHLEEMKEVKKTLFQRTASTI